MTGHVVYAGDHQCDPARDSGTARPGVVWQCDCGAVWQVHCSGQAWLRRGPLARWRLRRRGILPATQPPGDTTP